MGMFSMRHVFLLAVGCSLVACASTPKTVAKPDPADDPSPPKVAAKPEGKRVLAIFDIEARGLSVDHETLGRLSEYLSVLVLETGTYKVIPRAQLQERLRGQRKESYKKCVDTRCQIEIGREFAAQKTLAIRLVRIGSACLVTASLYDLKSATAEDATRQRGSCGEEDVAAMLVPVVAKISGRDPVLLAQGADEGAASASPSPVGAVDVRSRTLDCDDCQFGVDEDPRLARKIARQNRRLRRYRSHYRRYRSKRR